jgi:hypothetical protein
LALLLCRGINQRRWILVDDLDVLILQEIWASSLDWLQTFWSGQAEEVLVVVIDVMLDNFLLLFVVIEVSVVIF